MQTLTAQEIANLVGGEVEGEVDRKVRHVAPLETADPEALSFIASARYLPYLQATRAGVVLLPRSWSDSVPDGTTAVVVEEPHHALHEVLTHLYPGDRPEPGVHPTAIIPASARLGREVFVGPYVVLGEEVEIGDRTVIGAHSVIGAGCVIGDDVRIHPRVTLYDGVRLGDRVILHSGVVLGADGFGYVWKDGAHRKVPQVGGCVIGADVEIGANSTIDRGSIGDTVVGEGTKLDNLIMVGHNTRIGRSVIAASQVGVAGSSTIGDGVVLGGQVGIAGHLTIGSGAKVGAQAGVTGNVPENATYSGYPARPHLEAMRAQAGIFRLPELIRRVRRLESRIFGSDAGDMNAENTKSAPAE